MPEKVAFGFNTPFFEQLAFFKHKLNLPSERWDDIKRAEHDRAFIVAGAMKADLLDDLNKAVTKAIEQGKGLEEFRNDFKAIVEKHGWHGWTGEGSAGGEAWRTKVIYQTNMATSYAAGRYKQLTDPDFLKLRTYWRYVHNDSVMHPRPHHQAWANMRLTLRYDHPFWQTHFPPNGWGCMCRVTPVEAPLDGDATKPPDGWDEQNEKGNIPGIDKGFDYAPGASVSPLLRAASQKLDSAPRSLARAYCDSLRDTPIFERFVNGHLGGEFPVAVLDEATQSVLGSEAHVVLLSQKTAAAHLTKHPEITALDYRKVQDILDQGEIFRHGDERLVYLWLDGALYRAAIKRTQAADKNYWLTLFKSREEKADREIRKRLERIR